MSWLRRKVESIVDTRLEHRAVRVESLKTHYEALFERAQADANRNEAMLFRAWRALRGQTKGLQRQRRLINRLRAENAALRQQLSGNKEQR